MYFKSYSPLRPLFLIDLLQIQKLLSDNRIKEKVYSKNLNAQQVHYFSHNYKFLSEKAISVSVCCRSEHFTKKPQLEQSEIAATYLIN
jgi:hypothetical protein